LQPAALNYIKPIYIITDPISGKLSLFCRLLTGLPEVSADPPNLSVVPRAPISRVVRLLPLLILPVPVLGAEAPLDPAGLEFFEKKIRPVLISKCYDCHSEEDGSTKGELALDTRESSREGGSRGPAVVPGNPEESLLIRAIRYSNAQFAMPPKKLGGKLPPEVIADFEEWIRIGAPDPRRKAVKVAVSTEPAKKLDVDKAREFWAFQVPKAVPPPRVKNRDWPRTEIDRFVLAGIEAKGLQPVEDADRTVLLRRLSYDLTGLPPSAELVAAFAQDHSPRALETVVDRLLESPRFGERWGRFWLDAARFGESSGKDRNITYPYAWRYRDYVISAFNADKPYDEFIREQIAGDLLPARDSAARDEHLVATGFLAVGPKGHNETRPKNFKWDIVDDQIDVTSRAVLGVTASCARCHDHKFDPIPTRDYHALAGIFASTETRYGTIGGGGNRRPGLLVALSGAPELPLQFINRRAADVAGQAAGNAAPAPSASSAEPAASAEKPGAENAAPAKPAEAGAPPAPTMNGNAALRVPAHGAYAMGVRDAEAIEDSPVYARGDLGSPGEVVPRGFIQVLTYGEAPRIAANESGRLQLAEWLTEPRNPLTARVFVNRVWQHLFGEGIVRTADNFGKTGALPTNQELLDYLAVRFVSEGWSVKRLIRSLVLSRVYQLSSRIEENNYAVDPDNITLWRSSPRRLDAEAIRDSILTASGHLDLEPPHGSLVAELGDGYIGRSIKDYEFNVESVKRSIYLPIVRDVVPEALSVFDFAEPNLVTARRESTNVPAQALFLMNSPFVFKEAEATARRLLAAGGSEDDRIDQAFQSVLIRASTEADRTRVKEFLSRQTEKLTAENDAQRSPQEAAWTLFVQALFAGAEFRYLQ